MNPRIKKCCMRDSSEQVDVKDLPGMGRARAWLPAQDGSETFGKHWFAGIPRHVPDL